MQKNHPVGLNGGVLLLAAALCLLFSGCGDRQEEAVGELFESNYAFSVEEFFRASAQGDLKAVRWFLDAGMGVGVADNSKSQALHMAAAAAQPVIVEHLLSHGANPTSERLDGRTPLMMAAESGDGRSVELLLDAGCSALQKDGNGWSALALAAYGGFGRAVESLVPLSRPLLNDALLIAAMGGHVSSIDHLVAGAAEVDTRSPEQRTPLMLAAARGHDDAVKFLLHHGANWYATDVESKTGAQMAAEAGHGAIVNLLDTADLDDRFDSAGNDSFVPEDQDGGVLYSSKTRRIDGEELIATHDGQDDLRDELQMLAYRERQLPIRFDGTVAAGGGAAEVRLLFGDNSTYLIEEGATIPETHLELQAIEEYWSEGKEGLGVPQRIARLVVRDVVSGEVIGVTPEDPGKSAKSFALVKHGGTGQIYEVRRGDRFEVLGSHFRVMDVRSSELLIEELVSGAVVALKR
ncbi:MAG: ankyrin repeat protein [Verrucomicrobiales bacterium]